MQLSPPLDLPKSGMHCDAVPFLAFLTTEKVGLIMSYVGLAGSSPHLTSGPREELGAARRASAAELLPSFATTAVPSVHSEHGRSKCLHDGG